MFNVQKASIRNKALPLLQEVLANDGKKPNYDDPATLNTLFTEKYNRGPESFQELMLFHDSLNSKYSELVEKEKMYNAFVEQFNVLLKGEHVFGHVLVNQVRETFTELGISAIRVNVAGLQLQAQFSTQKNEFVNFSPFSTTVNPSPLQPKVQASIVNVNKADTHKSQSVTIEGVQYKNLVAYAKSNIPDLSKVTIFDKSLGKNRIHTPLVRKWLKENKGIELT